MADHVTRPMTALRDLPLYRQRTLEASHGGRITQAQENDAARMSMGVLHLQNEYETPAAERAREEIERLEGTLAHHKSEVLRWTRLDQQSFVETHAAAVAEIERRLEACHAALHPAVAVEGEAA